MLDFPNSPAIGQVFSPGSGVSYIWDGTSWNIITTGSPLTANRFNRCYNPTMAISQDMGDTPSPTAATGGGFPADQWQVNWGLTGTANTQRGRAADPTLSDYLVFNVVTATPSPAAGAYAQILQDIEGLNVKDLAWGTAQAQQIVVRFNFYTSAAGTYSLFVKNGAGDRTYLVSFTATASVWKVFYFVVPGDTTGTWAKDNTKGIEIGIGLASGTTYGGGVAGWQAGNKVQMAGNSNGAATAGNAFLVTDFGLHADPNKTGLPPVFEVPDYATELAKCQRYWEKSYSMVTLPGAADPYNEEMFVAINTADFYSFGGIRIMVRKRTVPSFTFFAPGTGASGFFWNIASSVNQGTVVASRIGDSGCHVGCGNSGLVASQPYSVHWVANARM